MTATGHELLVSDDWVDAGADLLEAAIRREIGRRGRAVIAVSGGSTPRPVFDELAGRELRWSRVTITQVDERIAPDGDPDRNLGDLEAAFGPSGARVVPLPVAWSDTEAAGRWWSGVLDAAGLQRVEGWPVFDVVHLGLGSDGHTASLLPGDDGLDVVDRELAVTGVYQGRRRLTLTRPVLERATEVVWLAPGAAKQEMVARLLAGDASIPAGTLRLDRDRSTIVTDTAPTT